MKKLINDPADVVTEALRGVELAHPQLRVDHENKVVFRGDAPVQGKVGIVSGGGSGHEPLQGGFVGPGGLDAACAGEVFTSPVPDQMLAATKGVDGGAGVLHIVLNYTGDIMNFEMAAELAAAEDVQVETVIMNDDVAVEDSLYTAGRRGVAATILLNKIAGAAADEGRDLAAVAEVSRKVIGNGAQHGHGADLLHRPRRRAPDLRPARRRDGGRHRRARRAGPAPAADRAGPARSPRCSSSRSSRTSTSPAATASSRSSTAWAAPRCIELYLMYGEVARILERAGVQVARTLVGNYMTSLDMAGCSVSLLKATTSCCACGTPRSTPRPSGGGSERGGDGGVRPSSAAGCGRSRTP